MRFGHRDRQHAGAPDLRELADDQLADAVRAGKDHAYRVLWDRHASAGVAAARRMTASFDPEDLVQEAYLRIWHALRNGSGPDGPFRPYLYRTLRNIAASWSHKTTDVPLDELPDQVDPQDVSDDVVERSVMISAFRDLPERWQAVLWYLEIEQMRPREAAPLLGLTPSATAALAYRAREGLRRAWLQAHVNVHSVAPSCQWAVERLGDFARGSLSRELHHQVRRHVDRCDACTLLVGEIDEVSSRLRLVLLPVFLGVPAVSAEAGVTGAAHVGAATPSTPGPGRSGVGRLGKVPVQGLVAGLAAVVVGAAGWAASVALGGPQGGDGPAALPAASAESTHQTDEVPDPETPVPDTPDDTAPTEESVADAATGDDSSATGESTADDGEVPEADDPGPADVSPETPADDVETGGTPTADAPTSEATPEPGPSHPPTDTPPTAEPETPETEEPEPSEPPEEPAPELTLVAPGPGTVTVFPRLSGEAPAGTLVTVLDATGTALGSLTVGDAGSWDLTIDGMGTEGHGELEVVRRVPGHDAPVVEKVGPYTFDLPEILTPTNGQVMVGTWDGPGVYAVDARFGGTPGLDVQAFVDGEWTGNPHTLETEPLTRRVPGLTVGEHTLGLRVVDDPEADDPRYGPTVTVTFRVMPGPFGMTEAVDERP